MIVIRRRRGVALVFVLIMSMVGMTLLGVMMSFLGSYSGATRVAIAKETRFNCMEDSIELAKAMLRREIKERGEPLCWDPSTLVAGKITSTDELIVYSDGEPFGIFLHPDDERDPRPVKVNGQEGKLSVRIYDMLYEADRVASSGDLGMTEREYEAFLASLPPSVSINSVSGQEEATPTPLHEGSGSDPVGAYLIRATLDVGGRKKIIETAVVQGIEQ